jgi:hypothetical protein
LMPGLEIRLEKLILIKEKGLRLSRKPSILLGRRNRA